MIKQLCLTLGAAFVLVGAAQAGEAQERAKAGEKTVTAQTTPSTSAKPLVSGETADKATIQPAQSELHPDARPVYLNGGHFGDN